MIFVPLEYAPFAEAPPPETAGRREGETEGQMARETEDKHSPSLRPSVSQSLRPAVMKPPLFVRAAIACLVLLITAFSSSERESSASEYQQRPDEMMTLAPGAPVEREISSGKTHYYQIRLEAGQYLETTVEQKGVDVAVKVTDQAGKSLFEEDNSFGIQGAEQVVLIAETAGVYRLDVAALEGNAEFGRYVIKVQSPRLALESDRTRVRAETSYREARQYSDRVRSTQDRSELQKAAAKFEESLTLWRTLGNKLKEREVLCKIGALYLPPGEFAAAREVYEKALALIEGNDGFNAADLHNLGFIYHRLGEPQEALKYYQQSIPLKRLNKDRLGEGETLDSVGQVYLKLGEFHLALEHNLEALQIFRELKRRKSEAIALSNIANVHYRLGEIAKAIEYAQLALAASREVDDKRETGITLHNIGVYHLEWGKPREALEYLNQALALDRSEGNVFSEAHDLATIGRIHVSLDEYGKALDFFNQALTLHRKQGNRVWIAGTLTGIGLSHEKLGDLSKAIACYEEAFALQRLTGDPNVLSKTLHALAGLHRNQRDFAVARKQIEEAIELTESVRSRAKSQQSRSSYLAKKLSIYDDYTDLLMEMHEAEPGRGYDLVALQNSERARARSLLDLLAEARADIRQGADPSLLAAEKNARQQLNTKGEEQTRLFSQRPNEAKASVLSKEIEYLIEQLQQIEARIRASSPRSAAIVQPQPLSTKEVQQLLDENTILLEFALGEKQSWLWAVTRGSISSYKLPSRAVINLGARNVYELLTARQLKKDLTGAEQLKRIADADTKLQAETAALSRTLLSPVSAQLHGEWKGKRLAVVASGALEYVPFAALPLPETLERREGETENQMAREAEDKYSPSLRPSVSWSLRPSVSPSHSPAVPLVAEHEVVNLPSASALALIRREAAGRQAAPMTLAALADPVFETGDPRLTIARKRASANLLIANARPAKSSPASSVALSDLARSIRSFHREGLGRLMFSNEEAEFITSFAPRSSMLRATGFEANRALVTSGELGRYQIVHFATHGLINSEHPELSGLVLSLVDEKGKPQDGFLRLHEIFNLRLPADLVVLSACQTALGKEIKGEGLIGLTRGFMYAGAERVVASLWQVDDQATAQLMRHFYRGMMKDGLRPAAALRAAQIEMSKSPRWSAPYFWAGFVIQGEWK
ncbi:MAG TPA: CHAT domain-containing protein [Blastocatellia bacterium]|nr:CHAT domain-containing protein [Blastocatellia bacterium]